MIVTAHQPNFLPGMSIVTKIEDSDAVIWLDEVAYSHGSWTNRNKLPNGDWLTVPVASGSAGQPINRVKLGKKSKGDWREQTVAKLHEHMPSSPELSKVCEILMRPHKSLIGLNVALLDVVLSSCDARWYFQSQLDGGHETITAVSDAPEELLPISQRLALMVHEVGGRTYLSGPSGRHYLDERPFLERDIEVVYWEHTGPNPCVLEALGTLIEEV